MTKSNFYRVVTVCLLAVGVAIVCTNPTQAQSLDPATLHVGAGVGTSCQLGCGGDPNLIGSGGTLDVSQTSGGAETISQTLLILAVPNDTTNLTSTYIGALSGSTYTGITVSFYNPYTSTSPVAGTASVAGTSQGINAPTAGAFYGSMTSSEVFTFLGVGSMVDNSNSFTNFTGCTKCPTIDQTATSFGIYVIALSSTSALLSPNGLINVTGLNVPLGTFVAAYGTGSDGKLYVNPFTEGGDTSTMTTTPEPSSMLLFGTGLLLIGAILRRRLLA